MDARETIELATTLTCRSTSLLDSISHIADAAIAEYWNASKGRFDAWHRRLDALTADGEPPRHDYHRNLITATFEEILASEILTRVFTAIIAGAEHLDRRDRLMPVVERAFNGHLEARSRVLYLLQCGTVLQSHDTHSLNSLRRRAETWTDRLIGSMEVTYDVRRWAPHPQRAVELAAIERAGRAYSHPWTLVRQSLRRSYRPIADLPSPSAPFNARVAASICRCLAIHEPAAIG
jgi:hypothetical protein